MKYFIACLGTETNTFSPLPTGMATFADTMLCHGDGSTNGRHVIAHPLRIWRQRAEELQIEIVESLSAFAEPGGPTSKPVYEALRDEVLDDLRRAMPVDAVLLSLHGAMIAEGYPDAEGDLLEKIRELVGPGVVIGAELDLHVHLSPRKLQNATVLVPYKEYPHTDIAARAEELFTICHAAVKGEIKPVMALTDTRINTYMPTTSPAMASFVARMVAAEAREGILNVSLAHGFPHGDMEFLTAKALVVADGDPTLAQAVADDVARDLWSIREGISIPVIPMDEALDIATAAVAGPVVLADVADNAGCGSPNDSTFLLRALLDRGITGAAVSNIWDPIAVQFCMDAGEGATVQLRIGGKCGAVSGDPVDLRVRVEKIVTSATQTFNAFKVPMGDGVWVSAQGIDIILNTKRFQTSNPDMLTQFGLDPAQCKVVVVKSTQHFYAGFAPIAKQVLYVSTPGAADTDTSKLPYENVPATHWPFNPDVAPFPG